MREKSFGPPTAESRDNCKKRTCRLVDGQVQKAGKVGKLTAVILFLVHNSMTCPQF